MVRVFFFSKERGRKVYLHLRCTYRIQEIFVKLKIYKVLNIISEMCIVYIASTLIQRQRKVKLYIYTFSFSKQCVWFYPAN